MHVAAGVTEPHTGRRARPELRSTHRLGRGRNQLPRLISIASFPFRRAGPTPRVVVGIDVMLPHEVRYRRAECLSRRTTFRLGIGQRHPDSAD